MVDCRILISQVFQYEVMWDRKSKNRSRSEVDKCWKHISIEMQIDEHRLRRKWKYLRDRFISEHLKTQKPEEDGSLYTSKWAYYDSLMFLKDFLRPRNGSEKPNSSEIAVAGTSAEKPFDLRFHNTHATFDPAIKIKNEPLLDNENNEDVASVPEGFVIAEEQEYERRITASPTTCVQIENRPKRLRTDEHPQGYWVKESKKSNVDVIENEHLHFFKSLIPHVEKIRASNILAFRCRIQEIVQQFAYNNVAVSKEHSNPEYYNAEREFSFSPATTAEEDLST